MTPPVETTSPGVPRSMGEAQAHIMSGRGKAVRGAKIAIALVWLSFQTYILFYPQTALIQCPLHLSFAIATVLLWRPLASEHSSVKRNGGVSASSSIGRWVSQALDLSLLLGVLVAIAYYQISADRLAGRMEGVDEVLGVDVAVGLLLTGIVLECVRRVTGWSLLSVILAFLAFGFVGRLIPGWVALPGLPEMLKFSGFSLSEAVENFTMSANGLLGVTTSTSVMFVFYFVAFGAAYAAIGGGQLFTDIGLTVAGKQRGGAAKAAIISSGLMGTVSGSAVANVAAVGTFTIPLMRATGYSATRAAAVEAVASTGGQLMPPVMGVAAFIMAELLQMPYTQIALAGLIPALAFYLSLFLLIDLNARKTGIGLLTDHAPRTAGILPRLHLVLPPVLLVLLLALGKSASYAAAVATVACVPTSLLKKESRLSWPGWINALTQACRQAAEVAVPIAAIGIIIEVAVQSNLALKFSLFLIELGTGNMVASLALIVLGCIVMGMGLPTVAAYMIGAIFFVPVMIDLGLKPLPAHFFVMYYSVLSMVTPPVALASLTAAGLAKADSTMTGLVAFRFSLVAFFIPFVFVFEPALLAQGSWSGGVFGVLVLGLGIVGWAIALEGYCAHPLSIPKRSLVGLCGLGVFLAPLMVDRFQNSFGFSATASRAWVWSALLSLLAVAFVTCFAFQPKQLKDFTDAKK